MPALPYNNNIPTASQRLKDSQPQLKENFESLQTIIEANHTGFSATDPGKHKFLQIIQGSAPTIGTTELGIYNTLVGGIPQFFLKKGAATAYNLSAISQETSSNVTTFTFTLTNGLIVKFGFTSGGKLVRNQATPVAFPTAFPSACHVVVPTMFLNNATTSPTNTIWLVSVIASQFVMMNRKGSDNFDVDCSFVALGV